MADAGDRTTMPVQRKPHGTSQSRPHPPHGSHHPPRNYKTLYDKDLGAKETIRRYNGHIPGHPKYDVKMPLSDPRNHYIQYRTIPPADLNVPSFTVDRNTLFYPKVEVAVFKLNDNVNKAFLQQLVTKVGPPVDLEVFYHPVTKKHMGMAMIVFNTFSESRKFVNEYNDRSIMGGQVTCCHDPYFTLLSQRYEDATGEEMRIPVHLKGLEETILNTRRSQYASKYSELSRPCHSSLGNAFVSEPAHDDDMDVGSPAASSAKPSPNFAEKHADPCTPVSEFPSTSRKLPTTGRPRTPELDLPPPPPSVLGPPVGPPLPVPIVAPPVGPPTTAFVPHLPPPTVPPFHVGSHEWYPGSEYRWNNKDANWLPANPCTYPSHAYANTFPPPPLPADYAHTFPSFPYLNASDDRFPANYWYGGDPHLSNRPQHHGYAGFGHDRVDRSNCRRRPSGRRSDPDEPSRYHRGPRFDYWADRRRREPPLRARYHSEYTQDEREYRMFPERRFPRFDEPSTGNGYRVTRYRYDSDPPRPTCKENPHHANNNTCVGDEQQNDCGNEDETPQGPPRKKSRWEEERCDEFPPGHVHPGPSSALPPMPTIAPGFAPMAYPPPPPYSALPPGGSTSFPPNYPHLPPGPSLSNVAPCPVRFAADDEKTAPVAPQTPVESFLGKRSGRGKPSKKKKKKRKRHSSESSSSCSSSNSSLNVGEYLRVEKKESTKYISREREGLQKTIVEEIKTVTKKKKYRVTEAKRSDVRPMSGLQMISSDESSEHADGDEVKEEKEKKTTTPSKPNEKEKKFEVHRWSSSSTDSESEKVQKKEKKNDILSASSSLHDLRTHTSSKKLVAPPPPPPPAPSSLFMSPTYPATNAPPKVAPGLPPVVVPPPSAALSMASGPSMVLPPTHLPPPFPMPPAAVGRVAVPPPHFNPLLPPPVFPLPHPSVFPPPSPAPAPKRDLPKVSLRFVDDSAPTTSKNASAQSQQTLADRVASIFGGDKALTPSGSAQDEPSTSQRPESIEACEDIDDMDVDVGSSISPPPESSLQSASDAIRNLKRKGHRKGKSSTSDREKKRFLKKVALVCEATEKAIGEEIVDVITKDFYKRIEGVSFEILEEVLAEIRHELEEQKRNEAQEALRAQAQLETQEKPSDVSQLCNPLAASLNDTPEKLGNFPFTINMPKLPSFKRKVRPPSPESDSSDSPVARRRSASEEESDSDDSGAAHKSSSSSQASESSDEVVVTRRKKRPFVYRPSSGSGSESSSELSSSETEATDKKSIRSPAVSAQKDASSVDSTAVSTASSVASSSESSPPSDDEERDVATITEEPPATPAEPEESKEEPIPLWKRIISCDSEEWSESLPVSLYHANLSEHCYFKLQPEGEVKEEKVEEVAPVKEVKPQAPPKKPRLNKHDRELLGLFPATEVRAAPPKPKIRYPPWSAEDRIKLITKWDGCFDPEDQEYLRQAWTALQPAGENVVAPPWIKPVRFTFTSWADKPRLLDKPIKKGRLDQFFDDNELDGIMPIEDGCARTRGYFKMSMKEKRRLIRRPEDEQRDKTVISERDEAAVRHNLVVTKESRSMHRRLLTTMGDANTDFFKVNQLKYRKKMIKFARSRIHGWGLYAMEAIAPDDMIVEYVGQKVRNTVADVREKAYERRGIGSSYLFRIDDTTVIDATRMGNFARFINHSCQPNCYAKVVTVDGDKRIVIYSKTLINKGDEITYDYKFPIEDDKVDCLCGAPNCRGTLN